MRGTCKLTGKQGEFVRANIIPRAFYRLEDGPPLKAITNNPEIRAKRIPSGIYDERLVIGDGESILMKLDDYAIKVLRPLPRDSELFRKNGIVPVDEDGVPAGYLMRSADYSQLKLFFLSVLWRAAASSRPEFNRLSLGPHLEPLRNAVLKGDAGPAEFYSVVMERFADGEDVPVTPFLHNRIDGVNFYQTLFGGFRIWTKCDKRRTPAPFDHVQMDPSRPVFVFMTKFSRTAIRRSLSAVTRAHVAVHGDPWRTARPN